MNYGGFWIRVGAYIIDIIVMSIAGAIIGGVFGVGFGAASMMAGADSDAVATGAGMMGNLTGLVIGIGYFAGLESSSWQGTLGKRAVGLVVADVNGNRISFGRAIGRYFAKILSGIILMIGYIMVAFTERKQGLHDMIAGTVVLHGQPGQHASSAGVFE